MPRVNWNPFGERYYEAGVDRGVLYVQDQIGVPWNGLVAIIESPKGGESRPYYMNGIQYHTRQTSEEYSASLQAFTYPDEFNVCDGTASNDAGLYLTQQRRIPFNLTYRTMIGNDLNGITHGYKIHVLYNLYAAPSPRSNQTLTDDPFLSSFEWVLTSTPAQFLGYKPSTHAVVDSRIADPSTLSQIEDILYGSDSTAPRLILPNELVDIFGGVILDGGTPSSVEDDSVDGGPA